jgi:hypothetical protein
MGTTQATTTEQSQIQTKELLQATFSCVSYLRDLFGDDCYQESRIGNIQIKKLRRTKNGRVNTFIDWLEKGCYDAIERKFLRSMVIGIYLNESEPESVSETYTFDFEYHDVQYDMDHSALKIIRALCILVQTLNPLPATKYVTLKLFYNENTPTEYEPPGFKPALDHRFQFVSDPLRLDVGKGRCDRETTLLKIHTLFDTAKNIASSQTEITKYARTLENEAESKPNLLIGDSVNTVTPDVKTPPKKDDEIRCICNINIPDADMLQCDECNSWLHTVCCGYFSNTDKRIPTGEYSCYICKEGQAKARVYFRRLAIYRRVLSIIYNEGLQNMVWLSTRVGISIPYSRSVVKRFIREGFIKKERVGLVYRYCVIKNAETKRKIKQYFSLNVRDLDIKSSLPLKDLKCAKEN